MIPKGANIDFVGLDYVSVLFTFGILLIRDTHEAPPPPNNLLTVPLHTCTSKACSLDLLVT